MKGVKFLESSLDKEWYKEDAEAAPIFVSLPAHSVGDGMTATKSQYKLVLNFYNGNMTQWLTLVEDQDAILEEMIRNFLKDKRYYHKWFEKWKGYTKTYRKNFKGLKKTDLSLLSDKELFSLHKKMWESIIRPRKISMMIDAFTFAAERKMI